jgi:hypothetical protein
MKQYSQSEAVSYLNSLIWHDSVFHEIRIIRTNSADQAVIILDLIFDEENQRAEKIKITFNDSYLIETKMNGGVDAISDGEMVFEASAKSDSEQKDEVVKLWKEMFNLDDLFHFSMTLASTDSKIDIVCRNITTEKITEPAG